ncbi:PAS domain S-box protein [Chondromyces crocatus]|uniref:Anti-anti-sigma factor n=1 Tax=Chondromyces crocatus TaxID=52 RepID=A0A0K1EAX7_CHOCO|nr:PAS domain S-box protein [Chondromyces crocatus]AKT38036.1 uncharacterized protein CMC5_021770 [Chondromyces crocatus]
MLSIEQEKIQALEAENERLRARIEELEHQLRGDPGSEGPASHKVEGVSYETIFNALPVPFAIYRADGVVVAFNDVNCRRFGVSRDQVVGKMNVFDRKSLAESGYLDALGRALAGEVVRLAPTLLQNPTSGRRFWIESTLAPIPDDSGVKLAAAITFDITEQKEAEEAQRRKAALMEAVLLSAPFPLVVRDLEGRHIFANDQIEEIVDRTPDELLGTTVLDVVGPELADMLLETDAACLASGKSSTVEHRVTLQDGEHTLLYTTFPLHDTTFGPMGVCATAIDITARVAAEEKTRQLQEEMLQIHQETLRTVSTPLIPIARGVVVMPLVGEMTRERASQAIETLLDGIATQQARIAILDVTGVPQAGTEVTDALLKAARSAKLLGAEVLLTGIRPSVAQALVELGADLTDVITQGTLAQGIAYALDKRPARRAG